MDTKVKKLSKGEVEVIVELTEAEFKPHLDKSAKELSKQVKIDGFREGKVPYDVLSQHVGKEMIVNNALDIAIPIVLTEIAKKEKIDIIARPKVEVVSTDPIKFKAVAPVFPEVKVDGYEKIKVKAKDVKVDKKDVEGAIERVTKQFVEWKEVLREIAKGDKAELDFEGFDEGGAQLEGTESKNHPLIIGENMMVPGFEDNLLGMKTGEEKEFELTFPKDYHKENFQNKKVKFHVKVIKVEKAEYPEVNEEFIEKITGQKKKVEDFKKDVERDLTEFKKSEERKKLENELLEKFLTVTKTEFSDILIDEEVDHMIREMKHDMQHKGLKFDDYLSHLKKTEEEMREEMKKEANKRITLRFGINEIINKEKVEVSEEKIAEQMKQVPNMTPENEPQIKGQIINSLKITQLFDRFIQ